MPFIKLSDVLKDKLNQSSGLKKQVDALNIVDSAQKFLFEKYKFSKDRAEILSFKNGVLKISAANSIIAAELKMREKELADFLNQVSPNPIVMRLFIIVR